MSEPTNEEKKIYSDLMQEAINGMKPEIDKEIERIKGKSADKVRQKIENEDKI